MSGEAGRARAGSRVLQAGSHDAEPAPGSCCARCGRPLAGRGYRFPGDPSERRCLPCACSHGPVLARGLRVALVVGSVLTVINQGDVLLSGQLTTRGLVKILLTYAVPFCVSLYSALALAREP